MSEQMTAVEWLLEQWPILESQIPPRILDQAKEMEKQQLIDACNQIEVIGLDHELPGEQYYNENFNK